MDIFGGNWQGHPEVFFARWREVVCEDDVVLIPGDISWAMSLEDALFDLRDIAALPGHKLILRGNHDYWWSSISKVRKALPARMQALQHDAFAWDVTRCQRGFDGATATASAPTESTPTASTTMASTATKTIPTKSTATASTSVEAVPIEAVPVKAPSGIRNATPTDKHRVVIAGTRGWDCPGSRQFDEDDDHDSKIYAREQQRLELSLQHATKLAQQAASSTLIVMLHYPPCNLQGEPSAFTELLRHYHADIVVYGHLHGYDPTALQPPIADAQVHLVAADALTFVPKVLLECEA